MTAGSASPGLTGSFTSLNNSLNPFATSTSVTTATPPDAWAYSPAYDLAPHLNLLSPSSSPYSTTFTGGSNNGSYSYATMLPQHDTSLFTTQTTNTMRIHQDYMTTSNNSPPPTTLTRNDYQNMVSSHSPQHSNHLGHANNSMSEDEHVQGKGQLDYVAGLSPHDKYHHEQDYQGHQQDTSGHQKNDYGLHSPPPQSQSQSQPPSSSSSSTTTARTIKEQVLVKSEPSEHQNYVQLPPFLN